MWRVTRSAFVCVLAASTMPGWADVPDRAELADAVSASRARIENISLTFQFDAVDAPDSAVQHELWHVVATSEGNIRLARTYGNGELNDDAFFHAGTYNGSYAVAYRRSTSMAIISETPGEVQLPSLRECALFEILRWFPGATERGESYTIDLESILAAQTTRVRPTEETVEGESCYVVDVVDPLTNEARQTLWLAYEKSYLPVQTAVYARGSAGLDIVVETRLSDLVELEPGVWFPVRAEREVTPHGRGDETEIGMFYVLSVSVGQDDWELEINQQLDEATFDYIGEIPAGTPVLDRRTGETWIASRSDLDAIVNGALVSLDLDVRDRLSQHPAAPWRNPLWLSLVVVCGVTAIAPFWLRHR